MNPKICVECSNKFNCKEYLLPKCKDRMICICPACVRSKIRSCIIQTFNSYTIEEKFRILTRIYLQCYYKRDFDPILEEIRKCYITWKI